MQFLISHDLNLTIHDRVGPGFQVRGGRGALKKIAPSGGRREHFWGISCEKSRFNANKSYFFQLRQYEKLKTCVSASILE